MTSSNDGVKGRIFVRNAQTRELKYLLWVEQKGEDFYWGSPFPAPDLPSATFGPDEDITVVIPEDLHGLPRATMKTSFHRSGLMHVTSDGSGAQEVNDVFVGRVTDFDQPTLFAAILSVPASGVPHTKDPRKKGKAARIFEVPDEYWNQRWYFDFSFAPEGCVAIPWGAIGFEVGTSPPTQKSVFLSRELGLLMVVRAAPMSAEMSAWKPEQSIVIRVTPEPPSADGGTGPAA